MPLLEIWKSNRQAVEKFSIEQVVSSAGDGVLRAGSLCSQELQEYMTQVLSEKLADYINYCLSHAFNRSGVVLQDLINELGRRLDYDVTNGAYQGSANTIGFDGKWVSPEGHTVVVEAKTTDAYRISLDTIFGYKEKLAASGQIKGGSSVLIVVGREETGELEAQVRGSRHAWDMRLISTDALIKLVQLKENSEDPETGRKIRSILIPREYTRLDEMIDVMFTTARDVEAGANADVRVGEQDAEAEPSQEKTKGVWQFTDSKILQRKREEIIEKMGQKLKSPFLKKSRATYWNLTHNLRIVSTISKRYARRGPYLYWYAYHPEWDDFLAAGTEGFLVLGCVDLPFAFAVPQKALHAHLEALNTTTTKDGYTYWHIHMGETDSGHYAVLLPKRSGTLALDEFRLMLENS